MNQDKPRVDEIYLAAVEQPTDQERSVYLDQACAGDEELRQRVEKLLRAAPKLGSFLQSPAPEFSPTISASLTEAVGDVIGPYKLLEQIGEGGFGIVYMADQQAPVRRRVALKIIKPGMDTKQVLARFKAELQALSLMDHPNIARALDAGATDSGRPYFVMELVRGVPITEYCDQNNLAVNERLDLFVQVCHAVQHAHQKGIIHRDIKPSNVLVTIHDGRPVPKVIDFGVAKAMDRQLTPETIFTRFAEMIGTPLYMSPEQAEMTSLDIDTRSDIYSLGVLLYELLTGSTPFEKERLKQAAFDEIRRIIREEEPAKPSTRISTLGDNSAAVAAHRHADPRRLGQLMRGDLDWIVMKALEKDRTRRYETANGLAMDLQRHLADEPVLAGPPSAAYRFRKFARRNRAALAMVAVVAVALVLGIVGTTWQAIRATHERDRAVTAEGEAQDQRNLAEQNADAANEARVTAEANFQQARQAVDDMYTQVAEKWLAHQPKLEPLQREFLEKALRFYAEFAQQTSTDPAIRFETARAFYRVADIQHKLGAPAEAERAFERAVDGLQKLADEFPAAPEYRQYLADTLHKLGVLLGDTGRYTENEIADRRALALQEKLVADFPAVPEYRRDLGRGYWFLGMALSALGRGPDAEKARRSALAIQLKLVAEFPAVPEYRAHLAESHETLREFREAAVILEKLLADFPDLPQYRNLLSDVYHWHGYNLAPQEAEPLLRKALSLQRRLAEDFPAVTDYRFNVLRSLNTLASKLKDTNRTAEAENSLREAAAIGEKLAAESPTVHYYRARLAGVYERLASLLQNSGRPAEAEASFRKSIEIDPKQARSYAPLIEVLLPQGKHADAAKLAVELARVSPDKAESLRAAVYLEQCAAVAQKDESLSPSDRTPVVEVYAKQAAELMSEAGKRAAGNGQLENELAWKLVTNTKPQLRSPARAVQLARKAIELAPTKGACWNTLGVAHYRAGDWNAAITALEKSMELRNGGDMFDWFFLAMAHWQLGEKDSASTWYKAARLWTAKYQPQNEALAQFRAEAAALMGLPETDPAEKTDEVALGEALVSASPQASSYRLRGEAFANSEQWDRAADDFTKVTELGDTNFSAWYQRALVRRAKDDKPGFQAACADMLKQFGQTEDAPTAHFVAWSCALGPDALTDFAPAIALAEKAAKKDAKSAQYAGGVGAILYRAGRFDEARQKLEEADRIISLDKTSSSPACTWFFLAMAHHRLGHADEAKQWLDKARQETDTALKAHDTGTAQLTWNRRLNLNLLRREAEALLGFNPAPVTAAVNSTNEERPVEAKKP